MEGKKFEGESAFLEQWAFGALGVFRIMIGQMGFGPMVHFEDYYKIMDHWNNGHSLGAI